MTALLMHSRLKPMFIGALLLLLPLAVFSSSFEYLYIEANEGNSSGGHTAIQFGDDVFHFQHHDSGLIRLLKQNQADFHFLYRYLQNRQIHTSLIKVPERTYQALNSHFKLQFLAQEQQFKLLNNLQQDRLLLEFIEQQSLRASGKSRDFSNFVKLKGAGLFYPEHPIALPTQPKATTATKLTRLIAAQYGQDYLTTRYTQIEHALTALKPYILPSSRPILSEDKFPPVLNSLAEDYSDYLTGLLAITILQEHKTLQPNALLITQELLSADERRMLEKFQAQLQDSLVQAFSANRPDWGYAVIIDTARLYAIEQSLKLGRWVFVDDFAAESEWVSAAQFAAFADAMNTQIIDAQHNFEQARKALPHYQNFLESGYSKLEMSANHYFELLKGKQQQAVRFIGEKALPTKTLTLSTAPLPDLTQRELNEALSALDQYQQHLLDELNQHYQYDLLTRNCATEIFRTIAQTHSAQNVSKQPHSKSTEPLSGIPGEMISAEYNFIPFLSFESVKQHYPVERSAVLDSFRTHQLKKLAQQDDAWLNLLRESNTFTSSLYTQNPDDSLFIFFTEDLVLLRPVFGVFNTFAGISESVYGLFSWPFDSEPHLKSGAMGTLMSLPELMFVNIRKGSFKYLSYQQFLLEQALPTD